MLLRNNFVILHYGEVALKGKNRKFFEERLVNNIKNALSKGCFKNVRRISGRILIELPDKAKQKTISEKLSKVFGIVYFAFAQKTGQGIEQIKKQAIAILREQNFKTFRISAKRSEKTLGLTSQEINKQVGAAVVKALNKKVDLENFDICLYIEIAHKQAFLYTEKIKGPGGLPVGVSGKAVCLLSGGIDSPVASWYAMKRGLEVIFAHLYTHKGSLVKIKKNLKVLSEYQPRGKAYFVPFLEIQKAIFEKISNPELCCVLCKRMMMRIAGEIAQKEKAGAIITGENLGQVASQTLPNMAVIEKASDLPVLKPLAFFDKQETIEKAKQIGTYDNSILPEQFFCQGRLPKHPATKARLKEVLQEEAKLKVEQLIEKTLTESSATLILHGREE